MSRAASGRDRSGTAAYDPRALARALHHYRIVSEQPLTALLFLLPMIVLYEVGTWYFASNPALNTQTRVLAFNLVGDVWRVMGVPHFYVTLLPGLAIIIILLARHLIRRDAWRFEGTAAVCMAAESVIWSMPLIAAGSLIGLYLPMYAGPETWRCGMVLSLGAGLYEELIFRLFAFAILDMILINVLKMERKRAYVLIVLSTAILFAAYHYWSPQSPPFRWADAVFRTLAGIYFGVLFLTRGFGITVGVHAAYDVLFFALHAVSGR